MKMIGEFWSRGGEKFSGDTGEVVIMVTGSPKNVSLIIII